MSEQPKSGLDIDLGNLCSKDAFGWAKTTFQNRHNKAGATALKVDGAFANMLLFGNQRIGITSDGIGTKTELAERTGIYSTLGYDLVAMTADDLATAGFEPTTISNIIDVDVLDRDIINEMMRGLAEACNFAGMSISGGEIAELGNRISGYGNRMHFNWCSTAVGTLPEALESPIDGSLVRPGQVVIALRSRGFRSNGFSLVRRVMKASFGEEWHNVPYDSDKTWGEQLLTPSLIYAPLINEIIAKGYAPTGIAHITGGGVFDNFERVLKVNSVGVHFDNLFEPLEMMQRVMQLGNIAEEDAYLYWNMGNGMLLTTTSENADKILEIAAEKGYRAQVAGKILPEKTMSIQTKSTLLKKSY